MAKELLGKCLVDLILDEGLVIMEIGRAIRDKLSQKSLIIYIVIIFFIGCIVPCVAFSMFIIKQSRDLTESSIKEGLDKIAKEKAQVLLLSLNQVAAEANIVSLRVTETLKETPQKTALPDYYKRDRRGVLGREVIHPVQKGRNISNIYLPNNIAVTPAISHQIVATEKLDGLFDRILKQNPRIQWIYVITDGGMMRISPYSGNDAYKADHDQRKDPFYIVALPENNPDGKAVFTKPYFDYLGTGWMVTCSQPVYLNGELQAVVCIDVRLDTLKAVLADFRFGKSGFAFLLDRRGDIIYHPDYIPKKSEQGDLIPWNLSKIRLPEDYGRIIKDMLSMKEGVAQYYDRSRGEYRVVAFTPVKGYDWSIGIDVSRDDYAMNIQTYTESFIAWGIFLLIIIIVLGSNLVTLFSKPILQLTKDAQEIAGGRFKQSDVFASFKELKILTESFNTMSHKLKEYTDGIIKSKNQLESVFNSIGGLLMILGPDYKIRMINERGRNHILNKGKIIDGMCCYEILAGRSSPCSGCPGKTAFETGNQVFGEVIIDNEIYHNWAYPVINPNNKTEEIIMSSRKVTEQVMLERTMAQERKLAGIGQLSAGIAHELKSPVSVIKGSIYLMHKYLRAGNEKKCYETLNEIEDSVSQAEKVICNLLDFSRPSQEQWKAVDVRKLFEQIIMMERKNIILRKIKMEIKLEQEPFYIYGQVDSFKHIFLNIIHNAIQASPRGETVSLCGRYIEVSGEIKTAITIQDKGRGVPGEFKDKVFQPFFTTKEQEEGSGLGLWIAKREVEKLSGEITLESIPGQGTTFRVIFPAKRTMEVVNNER